jgi:hypothetical protein
MEQIAKPFSSRIIWSACNRWLWIAVIALLFLGWASRLCNGFEEDELEHLHFAWNIGHGRVPYVDFTQHHPPLFHFLLAPFVRFFTAVNTSTLVITRLYALGILLICFWLFNKLLRTMAPPGVVVWGIAAWLLMRPFIGKGFELRPDWLALAFVFGGLLVILQSCHETRWVTQRAMIAGVCAGMAACTTQKGIVSATGMGLWLLGRLCVADGGPARRGQILALLAYFVGVAIPILGWEFYFILHGMPTVLYESTILSTLHWPQETYWMRRMQHGHLLSLGLFALAYGQVGVVALHLRQHFRNASPESLMAILLLAGTAAYVCSPAPWEQSFLYWIVPYVALLGTSAAARYIADPGQLRNDRLPLLVAFLIVAAVGPYEVSWFVPMAGWGLILLGGLFARALIRQPPMLVSSPSGRLLAGMGVLLLLSLMAYVIDAQSQFRRGKLAPQAHIDRLVRREVGTSEPILMAAWPVVSPFRAYANYYWMAHVPYLTAHPVKPMEEEFTALVQAHRVRLAVVSPWVIRRFMPQFGKILDAECHRIPLPPSVPHGPLIFRCGGPSN